MPKNRGIIEDLLPKANRENLLNFVREYAEKDDAFSVALGQWLLKQYSQHENKAEAYVAQVEQLFCLMEDKFRGSNRWRYNDMGLDWVSIAIGMENLANTLREKLAEGVSGVVVPPVLRFYQLLGEHEEDFMSEEDGDISSATEICEQLLLAWVQHPEVPQKEKKALYPKLHGLCHAREMQIFDILTSSFFANYLIHMQSPEEALERLNQESAKGHQSADMVHKHVELLRLFGKDADAQEIIRRHLCYHSVLDAELDRLYTAGEDYAALTLIDLASMQSNAGSFLEERKIRFLQRLGDTEALINVYRHLLTARWNNFHYYYKLKELVPYTEWTEQYKLIKNQSDDENFLIRLYAAEKDYPALFKSIMAAEYDIQQLVKSHLPTIPEEYHAPLLQKAIAELAWEASRANNRKEYARVVANINSFSKLPGAKPRVDELVARIRIDFRRKTAFMEELNKLL